MSLTFTLSTLPPHLSECHLWDGQHLTLHSNITTSVRGWWVDRTLFVWYKKKTKEKLLGFELLQALWSCKETFQETTLLWVSFQFLTNYRKIRLNPGSQRIHLEILLFVWVTDCHCYSFPSWIDPFPVSLACCVFWQRPALRSRVLGERIHNCVHGCGKVELRGF